tara:strand:- start:4029 stop:5303 length:1275 start_codon:yes stop_codon:yes gene_type:complete
VINCNIKYNLSIDNKVNEQFTNIPEYVRYVNLKNNPGSWDWRGGNNNSLRYNNLLPGYYKLKIYYRDRDIKLSWVKINGDAKFKDYNDEYKLSDIKLRCSHIKEANNIETFYNSDNTKDIDCVLEPIQNINPENCTSCGYIFQEIITYPQGNGKVCDTQQSHLCRQGDGSCSLNEEKQECIYGGFSQDECECGDILTQNYIGENCNPQTMVCSNGMGNCTTEINTDHLYNDCSLIKHNQNNCKSDCGDILPTVIKPAGPFGSCPNFDSMITKCQNGYGNCRSDNCVYGSDDIPWGSCIIDSDNLCGTKTRYRNAKNQEEQSGCIPLTETNICMDGEDEVDGFTYSEIEDIKYETPPGVNEPPFTESNNVINVISGGHNLYANRDNNRYIELNFYVNNTDNVSFEFYCRYQTSVWIVVESELVPS